MDGASGARVGWKKVILEGVGLSGFRVRVEGGGLSRRSIKVDFLKRLG